jgi:hypothetical protein
MVEPGRYQVWRQENGKRFTQSELARTRADVSPMRPAFFEKGG